MNKKHTSMANAVDMLLETLDNTGFTLEDKVKALNYCKTAMLMNEPFEEVIKIKNLEGVN